jgi:hypothetical protein
MYAPLGQPRKTINWRFCVMEGLIRTLLLIVTCSAFFSSFSTWPTAVGLQLSFLLLTLPLYIIKAT